MTGPGEPDAKLSRALPAPSVLPVSDKPVTLSFSKGPIKATGILSVLVHLCQVDSLSGQRNL